MHRNAFIILTTLVFAALISCKHQPIDTSTLVVNPVDTTTKTPVDTTKVTTPKDTVDLTGTPCNKDSVYFTDILPIYISACASAGCHNATSHRSGYQLTDYAHISTEGIKPASPSSSFLYTVIQNGSMPPGGGVSSAQLALINKWITQGAKNNSCNPSYGACDTTKVTFAAYVSPLIQNQCQGCHSGTAPGGGIILTNYTQIKASVTEGRFLGSIQQLAGYKAMPQSGQKFSICEINKISAWIKSGALNN